LRFGKELNIWEERLRFDKVHAIFFGPKVVEEVPGKLKEV